MKTFPRMTAAVLVALAVAGAFGAAKANPMMGGGPSGQMCSDMDARMAAHMAYTEVKLGLTDAQKAAFKTLTETMKAANEPMRKACAEQSAQTATAPLPTRMASMQAMMTARTEAMAKVLPVMTKFYDSLTPEQKKIADVSLMSGGHGHGGHHGYGGGMGGQMMGR